MGGRREKWQRQQKRTANNRHDRRATHDEFVLRKAFILSLRRARSCPIVGAGKSPDTRTRASVWDCDSTLPQYAKSKSPDGWRTPKPGGVPTIPKTAHVNLIYSFAKCPPKSPNPISAN